MSQAMSVRAKVPARLKGSNVWRLLRKHWPAYALLVPAFIIVVGLVGYPTLYAFWISLHLKRLAVAEMPFVGLQNYIEVLGSQVFWQALRRTLTYTIVAVVVKTIIGMAMALVLNEGWRFRGLLRAMVLLPWALPPMTAVLTWRLLMDDNLNVLNYILMKAGILELPIPWLSTAKYAMASAIWVNVWRGFPFYTITLLAGLQPISNELYDAAKVDGANMLQRFIHITLPGVFPVLMVTTMLSTIWTFNEFPSIWLLTSGGPGEATATLPIESYLEAFHRGAKEISRAVVYAISAFPLLIGVILVLNRFMAQREEME